jgi:peptidoglycan/LPS O-acetylase OafA/YrhL
LNKPSKAIAYCNRAVYPFYILHQTVIIVLAYFIINKDWALAPKFLYLSVGTFGICWLLYEFVIRRIDFLHLVMGVKAERKKVVVKQEVKNRVPAG